jgi:hypothetical protein
MLRRPWGARTAGCRADPVYGWVPCRWMNRGLYV